MSEPVRRGVFECMVICSFCVALAVWSPPIPNDWVRRGEYGRHATFENFYPQYLADHDRRSPPSKLVTLYGAGAALLYCLLKDIRLACAFTTAIAITFKLSNVFKNAEYGVYYEAGLLLFSLLNVYKVYSGRSWERIPLLIIILYFSTAFHFHLNEPHALVLEHPSYGLVASYKLLYETMWDGRAL